MTTQTEALKSAIEFAEYCLEELDLSHMASNQAKRLVQKSKEALSSPNGEAQPEQKQNLKLMPREATREMLEAMDECSMEGYDERLYAGHAASVYMAAWDAFHGQLCYCGNITNLGVIHRDDGPCHYPEHTSEYKRGYADAMNWKVQNHLEHLPPKETEQEPVALQMDVIVVNLVREGINKHRARELAEHFIKHTTPPQRTWVGLDPEEIRKTNHHMVDGAYHYSFKQGAEWAEAKLKEKNGL